MNKHEIAEIIDRLDGYGLIVTDWELIEKRIKEIIK